MENQRVMQFVEDAVKEEIRKGNLVKSRDVLSMLPEVIDTVHIDRKKMRASIEQCLSKSNPFNDILNLFGVQLIKKEKAINNLLNPSAHQNDVSVKINDSYEKQWITLGPNEFKTVMEKISQRLYKLESEANQAYEDEKNRGDDLFSKYERLAKEYNELKYSAETNEKLIAERIQYILSLGGEKEASHNVQLIELLKDLNIDVYWDCNGIPLTDVTMFTEYAVDDKSLESTKPCLIRNGSVYIKGMRFIKH